MPHLLAPVDDAHLRWSFIAAQREHFSTHGRTDVGLSLENLADDSVWSGYVRGLREGTLPHPGTTPLRCCEWWWVEHGPDGPEFLGRLSLWERPVPLLDEISWSIRPSQRDSGHEEPLLEAVLPILAGRSLPHVALRCPAPDLTARSTIEKAGGVLLHETAHSARYRLPTNVPAR